MTRGREQARRLASAKQLVARHRDGHELTTDELATAVEAGLLGALESAVGAAPLWPGQSDEIEADGAVPEPLPNPDPFLDRKPPHRRECQDAVRPCPWVSCRYHLAVHVNEQAKRPRISTVRCNPTLGDDDDVFAMQETCCLDVAEGGERTLDEVGQLLGVTRERVRQIELTALTKLRSAAKAGEIEIGDE